VSRRFFCLVSKSSIGGYFRLKDGASVDIGSFRSKLIAASILLLAAGPKLTEVRAYAQSYSSPTSISTVPQGIDIGSSSNVQSLATMGSSVTQGIVITTGDNLPGASTDSQGGTGHQGPAVPPSPGMPSVDAVGGLIPTVPGVTLTPDVPALGVDHSAALANSAAQLSAFAASSPEHSAASVAAGGSVQFPNSAIAPSPNSAPSPSVSPSTTSTTFPSTPSSISTNAAPTPTPSLAPDATSSDVAVTVATSAPTMATALPTPASSNGTNATAISSSVAVQPVQLTLGTNNVYSSGLGLDLSSTQASIVAPITQPVTITVGGSMDVSGSVVGGTALTIHPGQLLTPSQYVALTQVVGQGNQSIVLTDSGVSQSGSLTLLASQTGALSSLVLPTNVVLSGVGFSASDPFVVSGSTSILGSFFALQNTTSTASILNFGNLTVSGLLTANAAALPALSLGSPVHSSDLFSSSGLTINTVGFLNNSGVISSPAFLNINTGGSFTNTGTVLASTGNLAINSFSGNFVNSGMLSAPSGSININTAAATLASNINFNNLAGKLSAQDGINFRSAGNTSSADINISGGDLLSSQLNINAGLGTAEVHVDQLTGVLSSYGSAAHVSANTTTLTLGEQCLVGDPTYFNNGNIAITGNITVGEKLAIIASGNITNSGAGGYAITARTGSGVGQDITMIAGAAFTTNAAGAGVANLSGAPPAAAVPLGGTVNVTGGTVAGGNINLTTGAGVSLIDASGTAGAGGNVTLIAFSNAAGNGNGTIVLPTTSTINSAGSAGNSNGNIAIGAGRSSGAAAVGIQLGSLSASGGATTTGGNITVSLAQPTVSAGGVTYDSTGAISNGGSFAFPVAVGTTDQRIQIGAGAGQSIRAGGNVNLSAGGAVALNLGAVSTQGGSFTASSNNFGESINLNAGSISTAGGSVVLSAGDTLTLSSGSLNTSPAAGNGGAITLLSDQDGDGVGNITAPTFTFTTNAGGAGIAGNFFAEDRATVAAAKQINLGSLSLTGTTGGSAVIHGNGANLTLASISGSAGGSIKLLASPSLAAVPPTQTIAINGSINTGGSSLAVVSNGNITSGAGIAINTNGGSAFFASGASGSLETASSPTSNIIVSGRSGVGGNIDFATNAIAGLSTVGGDLNMAALSATAGGTTNGRILLPAAVAVTTTGGNVQMVAEQTNAAGNSIQAAGGIDTTGGAGVGNINISTATPVLPVTFVSATGALTGSLIGGATRAAAVNLGSLNAKSTSLTTINVSRVDAASSINGNVGTLSVTAQSGLLRVGAMTTSGVTSIVNGPGGDITTIGNVLNTGGGITLQTSGLAANGGIITINGAISETGAGDLRLLTTGAGTASNIVINRAVSESGSGNLVIQTAGANSDITVNNAITSDLGSITTLASGSSGTASIDLLAGASVNSPNLTLTTPRLTVAAAASITGASGDLQISSNLASRALAVALAGPTSTVQSTTGNVNFNTVALPGAITLTGGAANGIVSANAGAGLINLNGGANAVAVNANQLNGTVTGAGSTFTVTSGLVGSVLNTGAITATGNIALTSAGNVVIASDITTSGGNLGVTSGTNAANQISLLANVDLLASNNVSLTTPNLLLTGGNNTVTATAGDVSLQSNTAGNALAVTLGSGAQINAATVGTGDIFFNPTKAGSITVTGGAASGVLNAGNTVSFRGGAVSANVNQINGRVVSNGTNTTAAITTANGDLRVGAYTSTGLTSFTANGVGADIITTGAINSGAGNLTLQAGSGANANIAINNAVTSTGTLNVRSSSDPTSNITVANAVNLSGGSTNITTPNLVVNGTGAVIASTGNLQISSNAPANALSIALNGPNSLLRATVGNLSFNTVGAPGAIGITGGPLNGVLTANNGLGNVNLNGGLSNSVNVNVRQINGTITGTGTPFNVSVAQASVLGDLRLGPITSNGDLTFTSPANLIVRDDLVSNTGNISLTSGGAAANSISFSANADLVASANITLTTPNLRLIGGNNTVTATNGDVTTQSNRAGNALSVTLGAGSQINAATAGTGDIFFNPTTRGNISVTGGAANGLLNAGNTVSFRGGTVSANVNQINGAVVSNGATVTAAAVTTASGDLQVGPFTSSGLTSFTANGAGANLLSSGAINSGAGNLTLRSGSGVSDVRINNNVTTTGVLSIVAGVAAGSDVTLAPTAVVSGGSSTINTPTLNLGTSAQLKATTGALTVDSNAPGNALAVTLASNSTLLGTTSANFNTAGAANQGPISISGAAGSLVQAPAINYNVGPNSLNVNLGQLTGNNNILSAVGNPAAVGIVTHTGAINFTTAINTSNAIGNGGNINVVANGGNVGLGGFAVNASGGGAAGNGGNINISGSTGIVAGGNITSNGSAVGAGNGGAISLGSNANITVNTLQSFGGSLGNGGSITSNSANLSVVGIGPGGNSISTFATNGNGGIVSVNTTSNNPFIAGSPIPNGTASGIASNGFNGGGRVTIASNGATINSPISAIGGTGSGGIVTIVANNPATNPVFNVNSAVSAIGAGAINRVVGFGSGPYQPLTLNIGAGSINAGQQLTVGNLNTVTGLPAGLPSGLITITPTPSTSVPAAPFNTPAIVYNGNSLGPPPLTAITTNPLAARNFDFAALALSLPTEQNFDLWLRVPTDFTPVLDQEQLTVDINQENEELVRKASVDSRVLIDGQITYKSSMSKEDIAKLAEEGIILLGGTSGNSFGLEHGNMVFAPDQDIVVHAGETSIIIPSGAVVFVMKTADDVAVFDLHQSKQSAVHIVAEKKLITLDPGRLVVLTKQSARDFERTVGPYRWIGYRNPREEDINSEIKAFGMDFSIPSALTNVIPLKNLLASSNRLDRLTLDKVLKNSALLGELTNGAGPFRNGSDLSQ
jgi:hypothetical protein